MNSSSKINSPSKSRSTSNIINNIHTMSWLKQDFSSLKNRKTENQTIGKDGEIISLKKTNEDFFPGTRREEKKNKKKKAKKGKSGVVITNLQDLVSLTQQNVKKSTSVEDSNEILINDQSIVEKDTQIASEINTTAATGTVWSNTSGAADKLFPNVQSVRIDRFEEEEMLSKAIAESIATVQLEQFKRPSPDKENRWEALYGDFEDEGSWDNVKRNLPTEPETTNSGGASGQRKSRDDNNNSSKSGILRNRQTNVNRYLIAAQEHDFCFKTSSESSKDELEKAQSLKSVSFNESVAVKIRSSESSESDKSDKIITENNKGPNIDKYGRVDGYSERRLFMGKGARIREQEYIQNQYGLGAKNLDSESNHKKTQETGLTASQKHPENPKSEKTIAVKDFHKTPETIAVKDFHKTPDETGIQKFQKRKNPKQKAIAVKNIHRIQETSRDIKRDERSEPNIEKPNGSVEKSPGNKPASDIASNTTNFGSPSNQKLDKDEYPEDKSPEEQSDTEGPCLVPTLVRQDEYTPNLFTLNFQNTESISAMSEVESQSPACQNLILAGVSCEDAKRDVQSFMQRYLDPTNFQYPNGNQIYQNSPINPDAYSTLPNYAKMDEMDFTYFMHGLSAGNFSYQNISLRPDSNFNESGGTGLPNINTEYLEPITDLHKDPASQRTDNDRRLFSTAQTPPGFINNLRLPSGFTRRESARRCDTEERNLAINSPVVSETARVSQSEKVQFDDRKSLVQIRPGYYENNWRPVQTNSKPSKKHENFDKPQTADFDQEKSPLTENRKVPYPILGANQYSDEKNSDWKRVESKTNQSSNLRRDAVNNRSPNTRENTRRPNPNNNNYLFRGTQSTNSDLNRQEMNDSLQNSQSGVPAVCQMPDRLSPGSSGVSNWQYNVNVMNLPQFPMTSTTYYQMPMPNSHDFLENISPDSFHGFHPLPMHAYPIPHLMNTGVRDARNMRQENTGPPEIDSVLNGHSLMQGSIIGDNFSLDETPTGQFLPNYNFCDTQTMPSMANVWNMQNNQTHNNVSQFFDNFIAGRGRGRLEQKNNF